ncbi:toll-like receptor 8b [Engraulis encrasicolus]|uniref:toll-like receptor 8b n=1 Tax=Engraulis encrasicolus TaxID=184585 RepID=UPI002FCF526C
MMQVFLLLLCWTASSAYHITKWRCPVVTHNTSVHVDCSERGLKDIPVILLRNVTELDLSLNHIQNVSIDSAHTLGDLENLTLIDLNSNNIETFNSTDLFEDLTNLKTLRLDHNNISVVPRIVSDSLSNLSLASNNINRITSEDFKGLSALTSVNLDENCYFRLTCNESLIIERGAFSDLTQLTNLSLSKNGLYKVPQHLPNSLVYLKLLLNSISFIDKSDFRGLESLQFLDLSGNCPFCPNAPFPCKRCAHDALVIHPEAFDPLHRLEELRLSGNSLKTVKPNWFQNLTCLKYLFMSFNHFIGDIQTGDFLSALPRVEVVDLSYNNLETALFPRLKISSHFANMTSLRVLHLQGYNFLRLTDEDLEPLYNLRNLSVLNIGVNFCQQTQFSFFKKFHNLSVVTLVENLLTLLPTPESTCLLSGGEYRSDGHSNVPILSRPFIHRDEDYHFYPPAIKPGCLKSGTVLDLSRNLISYLNPEYFKDTENVACLNLSANSIGHLNGSQFKQFPHLKYLDLSRNRAYLSSDQALTELKELEILDLSHNKHYFQVVGLNHSLAFTRHLTSLRVLDLNDNEISTLTDKHMESDSLKELYFAGNHLDLMWSNDKGFHSLFENLRVLKTLDLSYNMLKDIPSSVHDKLPKTLTRLRLNQNAMSAFNWSMLSYLPLLEELHLSKNELEHVPEKLALVAWQLKVLNLSHNKIAQLSWSFLQGALNLMSLDLTSNHLTALNKTTFKTSIDGDDSDDSLKVLKLNDNWFQCTCALVDFLLWVNGSQVNLPDLQTKVLCDSPESKDGQSIVHAGLIKSCYNDNISVAVCYAISSSMVILMLFVSISMHLFYWDMSYVCSFLSARVRSRRPSSAQYTYNAFVMYDTSDPLVSDWVLRHLRVELEERGGGGGSSEMVRPLCLEERDWVPGTTIMDNLAQSVQRSRKTVFVLTEGFVRCSLFKMAAFLVHQRLLEEGLDVMVLLLLQPVVLRRSRILSLRRCLCQHSVLEWPANPAAHRWFWQQLRGAVRTERQASHSKLHWKYFSGR